MRGWSSCGLVLFAGVVGVACETPEVGSVRLRLELPASEALDPLGPRLAAFGLTMTEPDGTLLVDTRAAADDPGLLAFGDLPVSDALTVAMTAEDGTGRLLGFGRGTAPLTIQPHEAVELAVRMRRPLVYVGGAARLKSLDPTVDGADAAAWFVDVGDADVDSTPLAVATTPDGARVLIAHASSLAILLTTDHSLELELPLGPGARELAISDDSNFAIVAHGAGLTVVELATGTARFFATNGPPSSPVARAGIGHALLDAGNAGGASCTTNTKILTFALASDETLSSAEVGACAADLALDPATGRAVLALPAANELRVVDTAAPETTGMTILSMAAPTTVAVTADGRVWAAGSRVTGMGDAAVAIVVLASARVDGTDASMVELPAAEQIAVLRNSIDLRVAPYEMRLPPLQATASDLVVLPDGARVALVVTTTYNGNAVTLVDNFFETLLSPQYTASAGRLVLVDAPTGARLAELRTRCEVTVPPGQGNSVLTPTCGTRAGESVAGVAFTAHGLAPLFGAK